MMPQPFNLTQSDISRFAREGITRETLVKAGIWRVDSFEGAALVKQVTKKNAPKMNCAGIVFPYRYIGETEVREVSLRLDNPSMELQADGSYKEERKYLNPIDSKNKFYFTPTTQAAWCDDVTVPVIFVEGIKKALALQAFFDRRNELVMVIGLSGIWNWRGTVGKETNGNGARVDVKGIIPDFGLVEWKKNSEDGISGTERQVEIIFDAPPHKTDDVDKARRSLSIKLRKLGAKVRVLEMPSLTETNCKGIDDLIGTNGDDFVAGWMGAARQQSSATKNKKTLTGGIIFSLDENGVNAIDPEGNSTFVCSPLWIEAMTRDDRSENWGRLLKFTDSDKNEKQWAMPASLLSGDKTAYEGYLLDQGVEIFNSKHLRTYLAGKTNNRMLVVSKTGWHRGVFVLSDECIGSDDGEEILHQSPEGSNYLMRTSGSLAEWRKHIGDRCVGNSRLILAVAAGFAATLVERLKVESGGFHFRGTTSTGKTTLLLVGGSTWGGDPDRGYLRRWRATINGLESVAASHNDALLCLDELAEVDPWQAGETAYMLSNGQGKIRLNKNITLRKSLEWRLIFLSSGEISLADHLATINKRTRGGMEVRLIDLPADAGQGAGAWENLHDCKTGKEFSDQLQEASKTYYGTAARAFIRGLIELPQEKLRQCWDAYKKHFLNTHCPKEAKEEVGRVCDRFALLAFAGDMASEVGITGWKASDLKRKRAGDAEAAMAGLFKEWLDARGPGRSDEESAIRQIRLFLEQHSDSRFRRLSAGDQRTIINQAGYVECGDSGEITAWYILPEVFRAEVCKGYDVRQVAGVLKNKGWLEATNDVKHLYQKRAKTTEGLKWSYCISSKIQEG